jgi:hypothetical protein
MNILNFIPLLVWMLMFMPTVALCEKINGGQTTGDAAQGAAIIYPMGIGIFLIIGIACCK